jgi:hypothetical protein
MHRRNCLRNNFYPTGPGDCRYGQDVSGCYRRREYGFRLLCSCRGRSTEGRAIRERLDSIPPLLRRSLPSQAGTLRSVQRFGHLLRRILQEAAPLCAPLCHAKKLRCLLP